MPSSIYGSRTKQNAITREKNLQTWPLLYKKMPLRRTFWTVPQSNFKSLKKKPVEYLSYIMHVKVMKKKVYDDTCIAKKKNGWSIKSTETLEFSSI